MFDDRGAAQHEPSAVEGALSALLERARTSARRSGGAAAGTGAIDVLVAPFRPGVWEYTAERHAPVRGISPIRPAEIAPADAAPADVPTADATPGDVTPG